jgi:methylglutaconyl-CoA hydratase
MSSVLVTTAGRIGRITLNRPEVRNALDRATADALRDAIERLGRSADIRVIAIAGNGPDFCAGADLAALERLIDAPREAHVEDATALGNVFIALRSATVPTVALVHGRALAGGAGLASACDMVLAREDARFGYPEVRVGFVPAMVMTMLRRAVGEKRAFDLVATGRELDAHEAERIGLASRVLPAVDFDIEAV